jgi:hypothetical protein
MNLNIQLRTRLSGLQSARPVLEDGFIINACAYKDGTRTVTFEDPSMGIRAQSELYGGKGETFSDALSNALQHYHYHSGSSTNNYQYRSAASAEDIAKLYAKVDIWLGNHNGTLHAVLEDGGTILVKLEGFIKTYDHRSRVVLEGTGKTFHSSIADALGQYRQHAPRVQNISVLPL